MARGIKTAGSGPKAPTARPEVVYPPGFFTEPVRAWKQLRFESAFTMDKWGHMTLLAGAERARQRATGKGWGRGTIAMAGTPDFAPDAGAAAGAVT